MWIRIQHITLTAWGYPFDADPDADSDSTFQFDADLDPDPQHWTVWYSLLYGFCIESMSLCIGFLVAASIGTEM
jgi:hypothetical protein